MDAPSSLMPSSFFEMGVANQNQHCQQGSSAEIDKSAPPPAAAGAPKRRRNNPGKTSSQNQHCQQGSSEEIDKSAPPPAGAGARKRRRNNPDSCAEVIALSPKTLMAINIYVCEVCNKGFQRGQNLQLHKRRHNLPGKLKSKCTKEVKDKVYICPVSTCIYHDPTRALGDITAIKKHYSRKHGEKTYKCLKCAKMYANQCDLKAHSKTCGTREYRCVCRALFPRHDSFITHRALCGVVAQETARQPPILSSLRHNKNPQNRAPEPIPNSKDKLKLGCSGVSTFDSNISSTFRPSQSMTPPAFFLPDSGNNYNTEQILMQHSDLPSNPSLNIGYSSNSDDHNRTSVKYKSNSDIPSSAAYISTGGFLVQNPFSNVLVGGSSSGGGTNKQFNELMQLSDSPRNPCLNLGFYSNNNNHNNNNVEKNSNAENSNSAATISPGGFLVQNPISSGHVGGSSSGRRTNKGFNDLMQLSDFPRNPIINPGLYCYNDDSKNNSVKYNSNTDSTDWSANISPEGFLVQNPFSNGHVGGSSSGGGTDHAFNELIQLSDFPRSPSLNIGFYFNSGHNNNSVESNNNTDNINSAANISPGGLLVQNPFSNGPVFGSSSGGGTNFFTNSLMGNQITLNVPSLFSSSVSKPNIGGSAEMSATALLQKAAQMGSSSSSNASILRGYGSSSSNNSNGFFGEKNENNIQDIFNFLASGRGSDGGGACGGSSNLFGVVLNAYHNGVHEQKSAYNGTDLENTPRSFMGTMADDGVTGDFLRVRSLCSGGGFHADREAVASNFQAFGDGNSQ